MKSALEYVTGRHYDTMQVLQIKIETIRSDDFFSDVNIRVVDKSRHISFDLLDVTLYNYSSDEEIGKEVLAYYDEGRYQLV